MVGYGANLLDALDADLDLIGSSSSLLSLSSSSSFDSVVAGAARVLSSSGEASTCGSWALGPEGVWGLEDALLDEVAAATR